MKNNFCLKIKSLLVILSLFFIASCKKQNLETLILWTDNVEFASYVELFNASQQETKIAVVYKSELLDDLNISKTEKSPDLLVGSYLLPGIKKRLFKSISNVFSDSLKKEHFYKELLNIGKKGNTQYLLPVSFNIGALVFDINNSEYIETTNTITFDQIKEISEKFNYVGKDSIYRRMAFAPQWNPEFLYLTLVSKGVTFTIEKGNLKFNIPLYENICNYLSDWTKSINTSNNDETDFAFKYLYTPFNKQVLQQKSLFAYTTSNNLLSLSEDELNKIDFRWFVENQKAPVKEDIAMIGIYKKSKNKKAALKFIRWFMNKDSQEQMIVRRLKMGLDTSTFGIANGFSSLIKVNEQVLPIYYKALLAKTPAENIPKAPSEYLPQWNNIKREILIPHLVSTLNKNSTAQELSVSFTNWVNSKKEE